MKTNNLHQIIVSADDMVEVLYRGEKLDNLVVDHSTWIERYNKNCKAYDLPGIITWAEESDLGEQQFISENLSNWNLPQEYLEMDITDYLLNKCTTVRQINRVQSELIEFSSRDMFMVLRWLKYFVDTMRKNNLIWGVGRGSSVSSYVLFLLEIHKIDSLRYDLDIKEFLK
jgi:DNA polymerase III alpha subunit